MSRFHSIWTVTWKSFAFIITWVIPLSLFLVPFETQLEQAYQTNPPMAQLYAEFTGVIAILFAAFLLVTYVDKRPFVSLGFELRLMFRDVLLGITVGICWLALSIGVLFIFGWVSPQSSTSISFSVLILAGIAVLLNAITQEMLARGYIFQTIQTHFGAIPAIVLSSILFAALHVGAIQGSWLAALNVFGAGILFGTAYAVSKSLWLPIAIHFAWNFMLGPVLGLSISGQNPFLVNWQLCRLEGPALYTGGGFGLEGGIIVTLTTIITVLAILCLYRVRP